MLEFTGLDTGTLHTSPLNDLAAKTHATSVSKGFYEPIEHKYLDHGLALMTNVSDMIDVLTGIRKGIPCPDGIEVPADLDAESMAYVLKLLLIVSECVEAFHEVVAGNLTDEAFEVADIAIRLLDYAAARGIDLDTVVAEKMAQNEQRPRKHGAHF